MEKPIFFMGRALEKQQKSSINIGQYINAQKDSVEIRLKNSEKQIQQYKKKNDVNINQMNNFSIESIKNLEEKIVTNELDLKMLREMDKLLPITINSSLNDHPINGSRIKI